MANARYSASRFGCYKGCLNNYKLTYIDELVVTGKSVEVQEKGLAFHQIAELMTSKMTLKQLMKKAEKIIGEKDFDKEKYPVIKAIPKFYLFWQEFVKPREAEGFKVAKEEWLYSALEGKSLVGAVDLLLTKEETGEAIIFDYKSGATAKISTPEQFMLYAYMIKNKLKTTYDKIKVYGFYPLAGLKEEDGTEEKSRKLMLKSLKELKFTKEDVDNMLEEFKKIIKDTDSTDWENFDVESNCNPNYSCSWCSFAGHPELCPATYKMGVRFSRNWKVMKKEDLKKLQKEEVKK